MENNKQKPASQVLESVNTSTGNTNQTIFNTVSALTKPIELPYFVCSWLRFGKRMNLDLVEVLTPQKLNGTKTATYVAEWLYKDSDNQNKLAKAFMGGFSEDNTPYYRVEFPHARDSKTYLWIHPISGIHNYTTARVSGSVSIFTKAEIESLDSRYWLFAEPLEAVNDLEELK